MAEDDPIADLHARLALAVAQEDFELAAALRDELLGASGRPADRKGSAQAVSKIRRQRPGAMGLGTDQQVFKPPEGWTPPQKPDLKTRSVKRGGRRRS